MQCNASHSAHTLATIAPASRHPRCTADHSSSHHAAMAARNSTNSTIHRRKPTDQSSTHSTRSASLATRRASIISSNGA